MKTFVHVMLTLFLFAAVAFHTQAQIPRTLSYQGVLADSSGNPKPDGMYQFTFRLFESSSGGSVLWMETKNLEVKRGLFTTILGDLISFPDSMGFDRPYWLSIQIGSEEQLSPRLPLTAVAYSMKALKADTAAYARVAPQSGFVDSARIAGTVPDNSVTSAKIVNATIQRVDVASNFTAPYSDTAQYARSTAQQVFVDSARIAEQFQISLSRVQRLPIMP